MYEVRREECVWISMKDSVRLAAKLWIPVGKTEGDNEKFPAILGKVTMLHAPCVHACNRLTSLKMSGK